MPGLETLYRHIDRFVDGEVSIITCNGFKYTIPSCYKDIYAKREKRHNKEAYRELEHLVELAQRAMEHGDLRPFYRIYCLFADRKKHNGGGELGSSFCGMSGAGPKHLDYEMSNLSGCRETVGDDMLSWQSGIGPPKHLIPSDKRMMGRIKLYAWAMEGMVPSPTGRFRLGASTIIDAIPFLGSAFTLLLSSTMYSRVKAEISAPYWMLKEMLSPLFWAMFFAFFVVEVGDVAAASISPSRRAARKVKHWMKLRSFLSRDQQGGDGLWHCPQLSKIFPELDPAHPYDWRYGAKFRKELYGTDMRHLYNASDMV